MACNEPVVTTTSLTTESTPPRPTPTSGTKIEDSNPPKPLKCVRPSDRRAQHELEAGLCFLHDTGCCTTCVPVPVAPYSSDESATAPYASGDGDGRHHEPGARGSNHPGADIVKNDSFPTGLPDLPAEYSGVPWEFRSPSDADSRLEVFQCIALSWTLLRRIDFALRVTFCVILPAALIAYTEHATKAWIAPVFIILVAVNTCQYRLGSTLATLLQILQGAALYLAGIHLVIAIKSSTYYGTWLTVFAATVLGVAYFTSGMTTKMALFFWCGRVLLDYRDEMIVDGVNSPHLYAAKFVLPCIAGAGIGSLSAILPFPRTNCAEAEEHLKAVFSALSIAFHGCCDSVYVKEGNAQRQVNLARIRALRTGIDHHLPDLASSIELAMLEPWSRKRWMRLQHRTRLAERLLAYLDTMIDFTEQVAAEPSQLHFAQEWLANLTPALLASCPYVDAACSRLGDPSRAFDEEARATLVRVRTVVDEWYGRARHLAGQSESPRSACSATNEPETRLPLSLLSYHLFMYGTFYSAIMTYNADNIESGEGTHSAVWLVLTYPYRVALGVVDSVRGLARREKVHVVRLIEAFKLAFAMTTAVALLNYLGAQDPAGGAVVIVFAKAGDTSSNSIGSVSFVMATVMGSVSGFLLASVSQNLTQSIVYMCICAFVFAFIRDGGRHEGFGIVSMFFALSTLAPNNATKDGLIATIQQNIAAVLWLGVTHVVIMPLWPTTALQQEMAGAVEHMRSAVMMLGEWIATADPTRANLQGELDAIKKSIERQKQHLTVVNDEPTVKKLPYPSVEARRIIDGIESVYASLRATVFACQFSLKFADAEMQRPPEVRSVAWSVVEGMQMELPRVLRHFDLLCRELMASFSVGSFTSDSTVSLLERQHKVSVALEELYSAVSDRFFAASELRETSALYQTPSTCAVLQFFHALEHHLRTLVVTAVGFRRLVALRV